MMRSDEVAVLDGPSADQSTWPVEEAEALLADQTPLGLGFRESGPNQTLRFCRLAAYVNAHQRGRTYDWAHSKLDKVEAGASYKEYSTQDLLDILFVVCRTERFRSGTLKAEEPRLRLLVGEVARRVRSDHPPTFVLPTNAP